MLLFFRGGGGGGGGADSGKALSAKRPRTTQSPNSWGNWGPNIYRQIDIDMYIEVHCQTDRRTDN